jgi:hypothetical protein
MRCALPESLVLTNVDDFHCPSATPFSGGGYRKTTPALRNLSMGHSPDGPSTLEALGSL